MIGSATAIARGERLYLDNCALCHGERADGQGIRSVWLHPGPRDHTDSLWQASTTDGQIFQAIREGILGTAMPDWPTLDDDQVWSLVAFIRSVGHGAPIVTDDSGSRPERGR